jgi:hypothetical protein
LMRGEGFEDMEDVGEHCVDELRCHFPFDRG